MNTKILRLHQLLHSFTEEERERIAEILRLILELSHLPINV